MTRLGRFNVALALLILLFMVWRVVASEAGPGDVKKELEKDQNQGSKTTQEIKEELVAALRASEAKSTVDQHGSPLWYGNWGYSKLGSVSKHDDTISACGRRTFDSKNRVWWVAAGAWNNETRKWHVSIDHYPGDGICTPNKTNANHELHRTCIKRANGHGIRCGSRRSIHRG